MEHLKEALRINPRYGDARNNLETGPGKAGKD